jgi:hypothetical protein
MKRGRGMNVRDEMSRETEIRIAYSFTRIKTMIVVYYESLKGELKTKPINE